VKKLRGTIAFQDNQQGYGLLFTTMMLLALSMLIGASLQLSGMYLDRAVLKRNTNNTYYLAESAALKQVDQMNKALDFEVPRMIEEEIVPYYIEALINQSDAIKFDQEVKALVIQENLSDVIEQDIYHYLIEQYTSQKVEYSVQGDRLGKDYITEIQVEVTNRDEKENKLKDKRLKIKAIATTKNGETIYDQQCVEVLVAIKIPDEVIGQVNEKYSWNKDVPDLLKNAVLSYSDIWVGGQGVLFIEGDMSVGVKTLVEDTAYLKDVAYKGGVIAANGGRIEVQGNVYCSDNIMVSNGWEQQDYKAETRITIKEDAIAHTIGVVDDFYETGNNQIPQSETYQVQNAYISVARNVMVDNDVLIEPWVKKSEIDIQGTLFGVGGGTGESNYNPNQSSGVFAQGEACRITANRMYVAGQPFITLTNKDKPIRLWESIGEPFSGLSGWLGYEVGVDNASNATYLNAESPFYSMIATDKIETDFSNTYAVAKVSGKDIHTNTYKVGADCKSVFGENEAEAWQFFFQGGTNLPSIKEFIEETEDSYIKEIDAVIQDKTGAYLKGLTPWSKRDLGKVKENTYEGLKGYMTLMRSILYQNNESRGVLKEASFDEIINQAKLPSERHEWCYGVPIEVIGEQDALLKVSDYYIEEGQEEVPYPTLIINNHQDVKIKLEVEDEQDTLKGWIISAGPVELGKDVKIEGGIIVGGKQTAVENLEEIFNGVSAGLMIQEGPVKICYQPEVLLDVELQDHTLYRQVLDALYLTDYSQDVLKEIMEKQDIYTEAALKYTDESILELCLGDIFVEVEWLKSR